MTTIVTIDMGGTGATHAAGAREALSVPSMTDMGQSYAQANAAYSQANSAYGQANSAYADSNTRVLKAGDTMTGQLNISSGGLLVTGNSNFDSGTLFVDSVNNRIGVGTTNPQNDLDVVSSGSYSVVSARNLGADGRSELRAEANNGQQILLNAVNYAGIAETITNATSAYYIGTETTAPLIFKTNNAEQVTIVPSGNFGIKTNNPTSNLHVVGNANITTGINTTTVNATTVNAQTFVTSTGDNVYATAINAYGAANTRLSASGGTLSGDLIITGNLTVSGNQTILNTEVLTTEDADIILLSNTSSTPALNAGLIINRGTSTNTFLRWDEALDEWGWSDSGTTTYYFEDLRQGLSTTNTTFGTINTSLGTINTSYQAAYSQANTAGTNSLNAYGQANAAYSQANSAYGAANNRVLKAGDTMTGQLNISAGGLLVTGNVGIGTASPSAKLHILTGSNKNILFKDASHNTLTADLGSAITFSRPNDGSNDLSGIFSWNNGGLVLSSRNEMIFATGGTSSYSNTIETMRITRNDAGTGNVGIGTTNPLQKFVVSNGGALGFEFVPASGILQSYNRSTSAYGDFTCDAANFIWRPSGTEAMRLNSSGNVGIGTTSPSTKLHLYESGAADVLFRLTSANGTYDPLIQFTGQGNDITAEGFEIWYDNDVGDVHLSTTYPNDGATIHFHTRTGASKSTSNERLTILGNGNVGIATTSPQSKLEVATSSNNFSHFGATSTANGQFTGITLGYRENNSLYRKAAIVQEQIGDNSARGHLHLLVDIANDSGSVDLGDSKLMIHGTTGNVGIGTTSPSNKLHVYGSIRAGIAGNSNANYAALEVASSGTADGQAAIAIQQVTSEGDTIIFADYEPFVEWGISTENGSNLIQFTAGSGTNSLGSKTIYNRSGDARTAHTKFQVNLGDGTTLIGGNVGIGTASPAAKLDVDGNIFPTTDNTRDLGSASKRWANIYTADLNMSNKGSQNDIDGTWGEWTIQEGEEDLFLLNRRNGKKFKFLLKEIE